MRVGYIGRRKILEVLRSVLFPEVHMVSEEGENVVTIVDSAVRHEGGIVVNCDNYACIVRTLARHLAAMCGDVTVGIDLGESRNGVAVLCDGEPFIHATLDGEGLRAFLRELLGSTRARIIIGSTPYVDPQRELDIISESCHNVIDVLFVDEIKASRRRYWARRKYPHLSEDEVDAYIFALSYVRGLSANPCPQNAHQGQRV